MAQSTSSTVTKTPKPVHDSKTEQDFFWTYTEEPHRTRRLAIIKAHPEVRPPHTAPNASSHSPLTTSRSPSSAAPSP